MNLLHCGQRALYDLREGTNVMRAIDDSGPKFAAVPLEVAIDWTKMLFIASWCFPALNAGVLPACSHCHHDREVMQLFEPLFLSSFFS